MNRLEYLVRHGDPDAAVAEIAAEVERLSRSVVFVIQGTEGRGRYVFSPGNPPRLSKQTRLKDGRWIIVSQYEVEA